jgi:hypothetical protein
VRIPKQRKHELLLWWPREWFVQTVLKLFESSFSHSGQTILDISTAWAILPPFGELQIQFVILVLRHAMRNDQQARKAPIPRLARGAGRSLKSIAESEIFNPPYS